MRKTVESGLCFAESLILLGKHVHYVCMYTTGVVLAKCNGTGQVQGKEQTPPDLAETHHLLSWESREQSQNSESRTQKPQ